MISNNLIRGQFQVNLGVYYRNINNFFRMRRRIKIDPGSFFIFYKIAFEKD